MSRTIRSSQIVLKPRKKYKRLRLSSHLIDEIDSGAAFYSES